VDSMGSDLSIVRAAKVSTIGEASLGLNEANKGLINYLMKNRHGSPFEHGTMTFLVKAPIFVWREHMRHRIGFSYNEESGRYHKLVAEFYRPNKPRTQSGKAGHYLLADSDDEIMAHDMDCAFEWANIRAYQMYVEMLTKGVAREIARMVLPVNIMSSAYVTMNPRSLMNFLALRTAPNAQREIQIVASSYESYFSAKFTEVWAAFCDNGRVAP
jgi:thymidylate synthase (FAD)